MVSKWFHGFCIAVFVSQRCSVIVAMQLDLLQGKNSRQSGETEDNPSIPFFHLNGTEVAERGSWCLDGTVPGYYYKPADTIETNKKWVFTLQAGGWCKDEAECAERMTTIIQQPIPQAPELTISMMPEFKSFNHVIFWYCDAGLFSGDREAPISWPDTVNKSKNITLYMRGRRVLDHIIDTLKEERNLKAATDVLLTGGSAGGLATYMLSDYISARMPLSVTNFRAVPQSGWWSSEGSGDGFVGDLKDMGYFFNMHNMSGVMSPKCLRRYHGDDEYKCMFSDNAYADSLTPMFIVQVLDVFVAVQNQSSKSDLHVNNAWGDFKCVIKSLHEWACDQTSISRLNSHLTGLVDQIHGTWRYNRDTDGGFISTCNTHAFYRYEEFNRYAIDGVTMADAVAEWWTSSPHTPGKWHLPCKLQGNPPYQCEDSCKYTSGHAVHSLWSEPSLGRHHI